MSYKEKTVKNPFIAVVTIVAVAALLFLAGISVAATSVTGKIIALDAGHGGGEDGATGYCETEPGVMKAVVEADVNLAVRAELTTLLTNAGATAYPVAQLSSRKARVADAESAGSNVLISIHHNGSSNMSTDYTQSFVTQKNDKDFAKYIHPLLVSAFGPDKGIKNDGYGMTVYGSLPGVLTEAYFITNTNAACDFISYQKKIVAGTSIAGTRVYREAQAMYDGLLTYFSR